MASLKACYIKFSSFLPKNSIRIWVVIDELQNDTSLEFLKKNREIYNDFGLTICETCDAMTTNEDVLARGKFLFENVDSSSQIEITFTKTHNHEEAFDDEILDILQIAVAIGENRLSGSQSGMDAFLKLEFSFQDDREDYPNTFQDLFPRMNAVFSLENLGFKLVFDDWKKLFKEILYGWESEFFLRDLVHWNTMVKFHPNTNVKMLLLTLSHVENPQLANIGNVHWLLCPRDLRYIWKIHWRHIPAGWNVYPMLRRENNLNIDTPVSMLAKQTMFETKFLNGQIPSTCVDIVNAEMEQNVEDHIRVDSNNLLFLFPLDNNTRMAGACYTRSDLQTARAFYQCKKEKLKSAIVNTTYFRLDVREFPIFIQDDNYIFLLESKAQFFIVNETPILLNLTVSEDVLFERSDWVSADHCQTGTNKQISVIFPVSEQSLSDAILHIEGNARKIRKRDWFGH